MKKKIDKLVCPKVWLFLPALYTISYYPFWHFPPNFDRNLKESTETTKKSFSTTWHLLGLLQKKTQSIIFIFCVFCYYDYSICQKQERKIYMLIQSEL